MVAKKGIEGGERLREEGILDKEERESEGYLAKAVFICLYINRASFSRSRTLRSCFG